MIFMFIVHTPERVYKGTYGYVFMKRKWNGQRHNIRDKKDHFISNMISPYTKDLLDTRG